MTLDLLIALAVFAAICSYTPGPNNTLLMASGMNFGFRRSLPMALGVVLGFPLMIAAVGLGLGQVFVNFPQFYTALKIIGAIYLVYLAWKIATSPAAGTTSAEDAKPLSFLQMVLFQWINPKGWVMAVTALSTYTVAAGYNLGVAIVAGMFLLSGIGSSTVWTLFGASLHGFMSNPRWFRIVNVCLALALVASLWPLFVH